MEKYTPCKHTPLTREWHACGHHTCRHRPHMHTPHPHSHYHHFTHRNPRIDPLGKSSQIPTRHTTRIISRLYLHNSIGFTTCSASTASNPTPHIYKQFTIVSNPPHPPCPTPKPCFSKNLPRGRKAPPHLRRGWTRRSSV
jgi:hypothetical protein